ncbi:hypothetical protein IJ541_10120 [bacterium]|nr:hypothetical protein [bacterium]
MNNEKRRYIIQNFDETDDIIIPESIWGELVYIFYILKDIVSHSANRKEKFSALKRQIYFFYRRLKNN